MAKRLGRLSTLEKMIKSDNKLVCRDIPLDEVTSVPQSPQCLPLPERKKWHQSIMFLLLSHRLCEHNHLFHVNYVIIGLIKPSQQQWWICRGLKILLQNGPHMSPDLGYVDLLDLQRNWIVIITHNLAFSLFSPAAKKIGAKRRSRRLKAGLKMKDANISRRPALNNRHWEPFEEHKW